MILPRIGTLDRNPYHSDTKATPVFLRQQARTGAGTDLVEISREARERLELDSMPRWARKLGELTGAGSRELGEMVRARDAEFTREHRARIDALSREVKDGRYDFGKFETLEETARRLAGALLKQ